MKTLLICIFASCIAFQRAPLLCLFTPFQEKTISSQTGQVENGCILIEKYHPFFILKRSNKSSKSSTVTFELRNNSSCDIILTTSESQLIISQDGKVTESKEEIIKDKALITIQYKTNSCKSTAAFLTYWPYGHLASRKILQSGRTAMFTVPSKFVRPACQIAVPFYYSWETPPASASRIQHLIFSDYNG